MKPARIGRIAALLVAIALSTSCLADKLLLWPQRSAAAPNATLEQLHRPAGTLEIVVARSAPHREPTAFVLRFYGNGQLANQIADEAAWFPAAAIEWWGVNYPGYGGSAGPATLARVAEAARDAYAALAKKANGRPIIIIGNSMGTVAALHVAAREPVTGLVLQNPPPLAELILRRHGWWNLWLLAVPTAAQIPESLDSIDNAARVRAPALFLSSAKDSVVPTSYQDRIMKAYGGNWEMLAMPGGHNDPRPEWVEQRIVATITAWIGSH